MTTKKVTNHSVRMKQYLDVSLKRLGLRAFKLYGNVWQGFGKRGVVKTQEEQKQFDLLINGQLVKSKQYFDAVNPSTGKVFAQVPNATVAQMQEAIRAARNAFDNGSWSDLSCAERGIYLKKTTQLIREHAKELAELETFDVGKTSKQSMFIDVPTCAQTFEHFSAISEAFAAQVNAVDAPVKSLTEREPVGVVGCIIPYNYPLIMAAWKIAPALIAGNTVVFKPSPLASTSILRLAEILRQAQFPPGVINVVSTQSNEAARELVESSQVNLISFTGGTETGREIMRMAAGTLKRVILELGGKSANIVFADCDFDAALGGSLSAIFMNQGQMCSAGSRLLLEETIYEKFLDRIIEKTKKFKVGDAADYSTDFGPLISLGQRDKVLAAAQQAVKEGAQLKCGNLSHEAYAQREGFFIDPIILANVKNSMTIAQEEVFGPVLSVMKFKTQEEALALANDSKYGLAASVWTKDLAKAEEVAKKLQCGTVWINTYGGFYDGASFGGYKQSGFGRELGMEGVLEYTQSKHVCTDQTPGGKSLVTSWF